MLFSLHPATSHATLQPPQIYPPSLTQYNQQTDQYRRQGSHTELQHLRFCPAAAPPPGKAGAALTLVLWVPVNAQAAVQTRVVQQAFVTVHAGLSVRCDHAEFATSGLVRWSGWWESVKMAPSGRKRSSEAGLCLTDQSY